MLQYGELELEVAFPPDTREVGRALWARGGVTMRETTPDGAVVLGRVSSARGEMHRQSVRLAWERTRLSVRGTCSCVRKHNCEHVYALLLDLLETRAPSGAAGAAGAGVLKVNPGLPSSPRSKATRAAAPPAVLDPALERWLAELEHQVERAGPEAGVGGQGHSGEGMPLRYTLTAQEGKVGLRVWAAQLGPEAQAVRFRLFSVPHAIQALPEYARGDFELLDLLLGRSLRVDREGVHHLREGPGSAALLLRLLDTARLHWQVADAPALQPGPERRGEPGWTLEADGWQCPVLRLEPGLQELPGVGGLYLEPRFHRLGRVRVDWPERVLDHFLRAPAVPPEAVAGVMARLERPAGTAQVGVPTLPTLHAVAVPPPYDALVRRLTLFSHVLEVGFRRQVVLDSAKVWLGYGDQPLGALLGSVLEVRDRRGLRTFGRDHAAEKQAFALLERVGLRPLHKIWPQQALPQALQGHWTLEGTLEQGSQVWLPFLAEQVPLLQAEGWCVLLDGSSRFAVYEVEAWHAQLEPRGEQWFDLALGIEVQGQRHDLLPILGDLARRYPPELLAALPTHEPLVYVMHGGMRVSLPLERIRPLLETLVELYNRPPGEGVLRLPRLDAVRLAQLEARTELRWWGGEALRALGRKLHDFRQIAPVVPSPHLQATLRPYQLEGLAWLCFLREHGLGGLLADDMGLGKTLQTLAFLQLEHRVAAAGRPSLVVVPTSVLDTWVREAARFTPDLRVRVWHGEGRSEHLATLAEHDVVLTTYALVWRDLAQLERHSFHMLVLDEAQMVKNNRSKAYAALSLLRAEGRLCLTGTPLENHLGELWSLFHFLMPGLLGEAADFKRHYRLPIERESDRARRTQLADRVRPFLLRRRKDQVAPELPPRSETVVYLPLEGAQRDLYETLRISLHFELERTLAAQGLERSQIHVLDALLKLRQVCCAPSLVKLEPRPPEDGVPEDGVPEDGVLERLRRLRDAAPSVKLEWLASALPALLEAGRRVLIFSQFTALLACVEVQLQAWGQPYSRLIGKTRDRPEQVRRFQDGETPVFLISLKAGGVGLTLTAADTVIHLDPWWNPQVERQATDRAHRIGQTQAVMVYKLIAAGSLEERLLELQARKAELAQGVLEGSLGEGLTLSREDLAQLLSALPSR